MERTKTKISSNMEDYLEAIAMLKDKNGVARVRDISLHLKVKKPSVTAALSTLSRDGFIIHERYGYVDLTSSGREKARSIQKMHEMLFKFLSKILQIDDEVAEKDACHMEHAISPQTFARLAKFISFIETCPGGSRPDWLKSFDYYSKTGKRLACKTRQDKPDREMRSEQLCGGK